MGADFTGVVKSAQLTWGGWLGLGRDGPGEHSARGNGLREAGSRNLARGHRMGCRKLRPVVSRIDGLLVGSRTGAVVGRKNSVRQPVVPENLYCATRRDIPSPHITQPTVRSGDVDRPLPEPKLPLVGSRSGAVPRRLPLAVSAVSSIVHVWGAP